jgi:hypothetical protein
MSKIVIESGALAWSWCVVIDNSPNGRRFAERGITKTLGEAWEMATAYMKTICVEPDINKL